MNLKQHIETRVSATVICDASFCDTSRSAGWAAWVRVDGIQNAIKASGQISSALARSSTDSEVCAAIFGAMQAISHGANCVLIQSDCMAVVNAESQKWKDFASKNNNVTFTFKHVKGHQGAIDKRSWCNEWCDIWAKKNMRSKRRSLGR